MSVELHKNFKLLSGYLIHTFNSRFHWLALSQPFQWKDISQWGLHCTRRALERVHRFLNFLQKEMEVCSFRKKRRKLWEDGYKSFQEGLTF